MKYILYAASAILVIFNILLLQKHFQFKKDLVTKTSQALKERENSQRILMAQVLLNEGFAFERNMSVSDLSGVDVKLLDVMNEGSKLVLRFSQNSCKPCIDKQIEFLEEFSKVNGRDKVVLLMSSSNANDLKIFKQTNNVSLPIFRLAEGLVPSVRESQNAPYLFLLNKDLRTSLIFTPDKEIHTNTAAYYRQVSDYLQKYSPPSGTRTEGTLGVFDTNEYNLGTINYGEKAEAAFTLKNTGKSPLLIQTVNTSCGCTVVDWEKSPIMPHDSSVIKVVYDSKIVGSFSKDIFVLMNTQNSPVRLIIKGNVEEQ